MICWKLKKNPNKIKTKPKTTTRTSSVSFHAVMPNILLMRNARLFPFLCSQANIKVPDLFCAPRLYMPNIKKEQLLEEHLEIHKKHFNLELVSSIKHTNISSLTGRNASNFCQGKEMFLWGRQSSPNYQQDPNDLITFC